LLRNVCECSKKGGAVQSGELPAMMTLEFYKADKKWDIQFLLTPTFQVFILPLLTAVFGILIKAKAFNSAD